MTFEESLQYDPRWLLWSVLQLLDNLESALTERTNEIMATSQEVRQQITGIKDAVVALKTYEEGRNQQVDELKAKVKELMDADAAEQADIDAAFDGLKSTEADIRAIFAGTPADPVKPAVDPVTGV